ncbi:microtubule-associated protein Jupiter isoform X2 [Episyrphus balteatus]|uniref:microtubule-associated protein Jupiter isoform X2 n=1 Tax=Episyrphus balteatus TaxID=286459 RepID=UPI00248627CE|nr:microtubule-associated protein Jupiter isoform X2 [Episyrphus balteatus]
MATYAAFKHVELYNVGKTKKRVLRPPGGGSTDIFGSDVPSTPRSVKNHMQSNIFSCEKGSVKNNVRQGAHRFYFIGDQPRRGQKNTDSYTRLFGDVDRPFTPAKNHMKSNLGFSGNNAAAENGNGNNATANGNGHHASNGRNGKFENGGSSSSASSVSSSTENLKMNGLSKTELDETSVVSSSPRRLIESGISKDEKIIISNDSPSARSSSSIKITEKTLIGGGDGGSSRSPSRRTLMNSSEDSRSELTTSTSFSQKSTSATSGSNKSSTSRNPITGLGLGAEGLKSRRNVYRRDGNPVTGEGYKPAGAEINTTIPSLNGANQVINKNRIPPGGFSSGLW